ncbi:MULTISPECIES: [FeFe] hydrogenase H-cluster radical SAM maturase HydE [Thermoanaerobacterium]|uniref:Radical SAM protein n=2 Tax=Thermoanaerobacterium TaxID=28895 RepID=W9ECA8_9THEO|nr:MULTISPECIES: [FeFe] hydrogenase H-cluster radical SAM maturase HydE [Thermoanaerobacterium]AFK85566.1 Radical SAM domain protein [Thermoanaerobacterium saccharolyticum JW/SL-YS485]ETO39717.1 radical SAM protein [Thermoanaerobacterium aotearoense SCUT27]
MEYCIIICNSTQHMLNADKILKENNIKTELIPAPAEYGSVCSTAIKIDAYNVDVAEKLLKNNSVSVKGIYPYKIRKLDGLVERINRRLSGDIKAVLEKVEKGIDLTEDDIVLLLSAEGDENLSSIYKAADEMRKAVVGDVVDIRAAIEFSNICRKNCLYCGLRRDNSTVDRYRMDADEIVETAKELKRMGIKTVILQSGEDPWYTEDKIIEIIRKIKKETNMRITLSIGERTEEEYKHFREAGANNFLLKIETTNREVFKNIHPDDDFDYRVKCSQWLRENGYINGNGNIIGLPGQTARDIARDILFFKDMGIHMVGIGPFVPAVGTPLETYPHGSVEMTLKTVAATRLVLKNVFIPATTALATVDKEAQVKALMAGANTIMLISTPSKYRSRYRIYSNKNMVDLKTAYKAIVKAGRKLPPYINKDYIKDIV